MLRNNLKIALRNLTRHKVYSLINIIGLGVGIACAVLTILWIQYELSFDRFHKNADKLFRVVFTNNQGDFHGFYQPGPLANYLKESFPEVEHATNYSEMECKISRETQGFFCTGSFVDSSFFKMFSFPLIEGNSNSVLSSPNSIVISKSLSDKLFGGINPVGKTLKLDDRSEAVVAGVFSDVPKTSHMQFDFVIPFSTAPDWMKMWDRKCVNTYLLFRDNVSFDEVNNKISRVMDEHNPEWKNILYLFPITKSHLYEPGETGTIIYMYIFSAFSFLILIVACINFMNLSTVRSQKRMKEIGIKKTIGSSRMDLIKQFMIETLQLSFISLLLAVVLVELALPFLNSMLNAGITLTYSWEMFLVLLGVTLFAGLTAGSYPSLYLSSLKPILVLNDRTSKSGEKRSSVLRNTLVIAQFSFSIFIITCVLIIGNQLKFIQSKNLGFNKEQVLVVSARGALQQSVPILKEELLKLSSVQSVSASATNLTDFQGAGTGPVDWEGKNPDKIMEVGFNFVDGDFAKTLQVKMKQGRFFSKEFPTDMSEAFVVNESAVKLMGIENPINKNLTTWFGRKGKIIGVISDFNTSSLKEEMTPVVFLMASSANNLFVRISPVNISETLSLIEDKLKEIVPDDPFEYRFLDEHINTLYRTEQITAEFAAFIAVLAIFISCLGLFGLASFSGEQRTKEIGVRKVLGASVINVLLMLSKDFLKWIVLANIIAWPAAYFVMNKWLQDFAYRTEIEWSMFLIAGLIALLIALLTISIQTIKAALANPIDSLKYE